MNNDNLFNLKEELEKKASSEISQNYQRFFKTGKDQYAEHDIFLGISVPEQRKLAKKYFSQISLSEIVFLLREEIHEFRLTALFLLVYRYQKSQSDSERELIAETYLTELQQVNNWDLVDSSAYQILGDYLFSRERKILYSLAKSENLWFQRVAIIATFSFIKKNDFSDTLKLSQEFLTHQHDLIHKAVGWMLREIGKRDLLTELNFLEKNYQLMPRTMLRYAIERLNPEQRAFFMKKSPVENFSSGDSKLRKTISRANNHKH